VTAGCRGRVAGERHSGGFNSIFADGHAKWYRFEATFHPKFLYGPEIWPQVRR
jgi:prepilin-type processing-associated H-X9-DG protein